MIPHLASRVAALEPLGWTGRDAEWLTLVCLHSGAFVRSQYLAFVSESHTQIATRFVRRCGKAVVEEQWNTSADRLIRVMSREVYRALGAEHIRHRRKASEVVLRRRVLSLDYVLEHLAEAWLPTENEKVEALCGAGVPRAALPRRVYKGSGKDGTGQERYFVEKLPVALSETAARFIFVQPPGDVSQSALTTWGECHAGVWASLLVRSVAVSVVVVGVDPVRLAAAAKVLEAWAVPAPPLVRDVARELTELRAGLSAADPAVLDRVGGFNAGVARMVKLEQQVKDAPAVAGAVGRSEPRISSGETWRSARVRAGE